MRFLTLAEILQLHQLLVQHTGGSHAVRDLGALESAVAQPRMTFGGRELYPTLEEKATAIGFSLISSHPFIDGNKRVGHAAMETFLMLNGLELRAAVDDAEQIIFDVAAGRATREDLLTWVRAHAVSL